MNIDADSSLAVGAPFRACPVGGGRVASPFSAILEQDGRAGPCDHTAAPRHPMGFLKSWQDLTDVYGSV